MTRTNQIPEINLSESTRKELRTLYPTSKFPEYTFTQIPEISYCLLDPLKISCYTTPSLFKNCSLDRRSIGKLLESPINQDKFILHRHELYYKIGNQYYRKDKLDRALKLFNRNQLKIYYHDSISYNLILIDNMHVFAIAPNNDTDKEGNLIISGKPDFKLCTKSYKQLMKLKKDDMVELINNLRSKYHIFLTHVDKTYSKHLLLWELVRELKQRPENRKHYKEYLNSIIELGIMKKNYRKWDMEHNYK